jgi:hypothetical protein
MHSTYHASDLASVFCILLISVEKFEGLGCGHI